jgi:hypothetical protein
LTLIVGFRDSKVATASFNAEVSDGEEPHVESEIVVTASAALACGASESVKASANNDTPIGAFFILPPCFIEFERSNNRKAKALWQ